MNGEQRCRSPYPLRGSVPAFEAGCGAGRVLSTDGGGSESRTRTPGDHPGSPAFRTGAVPLGHPAANEKPPGSRGILGVLDDLLELDQVEHASGPWPGAQLDEDERKPIIDSQIVERLTGWCNDINPPSRFARSRANR